MTTYYVSNAATNGYAVGNNSNTSVQAQSKSTPWLTLAGAVGNSAVVNGDTIILNAGTYSETAFVNVGKQLTIKADAGLTATIQDATNSDSRVIHFAQAAQGSILGDPGSTIVLDGRSQNSGCLTTDSSNQLSSLTLIGVHAINFTQYGIRVFKCAAFVMIDANWLVTVGACSNATSAAIRLDPGSATDVYTIKNGSITGTFASSVSTNAYGIFQANPGAAGVTVDVENVNVNVSTAATSGTQQGMMFNIGAQLAIKNNAVTVAQTAATTSNLIDGIAVGVSATGLTSTSVVVNKNTVTLPTASTAFGGHGIIVGADTQASAGPVGPTGYNGATGVVVSQNSVTGGNHGILIAWLSGALSWGNTVTGTILGLVDKHCGTNYGGTYNGIPNLWCGNIVNFVSNGANLAGSSCLYAKASVGTIFANNLVLLDATSNGSIFLKAANDPSGTVVAASGIVYANNLLYVTGASAATAAVSVGNDGSTATFFTNDYYSVPGFANNAWVYQATNYANLGAWQAAKETGALGVTPSFANFSGGDYHQQVGSPLYLAGTFASASSLGYDGHPFSVTPTIGPYEILPIKMTPVKATAPYGTTGATLTWQAGDPNLSVQISMLGRQLLLARNTDANNAHMLTVIAYPDSQGRTNNLIQSIPANTTVAVGPLHVSGWASPGGTLLVSVDNIALQLTALDLRGTGK